MIDGINLLSHFLKPLVDIANLKFHLSLMVVDGRKFGFAIKAKRIKVLRMLLEFSGFG